MRRKSWILALTATAIAISLTSIQANATPGAVLWTKYTTGSEADVGPLVANGIVYYGEGSGPVYAWNATTGAQLWDYTMPNASEAVNGEPVVVGNTIYLGGYGGSVAALNATTGAVLWTKYTTGSEADIGPLVANGIVYYGEGSGPVYAWNATTGAQLWDYTMPNASEAVNGEPVVVGNTIYLGGYGGSIAALSTS